MAKQSIEGEQRGVGDGTLGFGANHASTRSVVLFDSRQRVPDTPQPS